MTFINVTDSFSSVITSNVKVLALEQTLKQSLQDFKEVLTDFEKLHITCNTYQTQYIKQKEKCESNCCNSAEILKKVIESKDIIIQSVASTLTKLIETKDFKIINNIFKILFGEFTNPVPLKQENLKIKDRKKVSPSNIKKEANSSNEDLSFNDDSVSEIEGTPTGRTSPIIQTKKMKTSMSNASDLRDKKKCPESWPTPEKKALKLTYSTPLRGSKQTGKMRQSRLNIVKMKEKKVIDITSSPEFSGGCRSKNSDGNVEPLIKKEFMENDDTIQPSPTSGPTNFTLYKSRESPMKFKKPQLSLKVKTENSSKTPKKKDRNMNTMAIKQEPNSENKFICNMKMNDSVTFTQDDSINILNPKRLPNAYKNGSPMKNERCDDETYCDSQSSISLLNHVDEIVNVQCSPSKRPLAENINVTNMADDVIQPSMSILQREAITSKIADDNVRRKIPEFLDEAYDGPIRKKAEKRLLPGWSCDKCIEFFGELYKDDPVMMEKKINECSHHRSVQNPNDRPKTPPGYWNPRWNVPDDTEEFNKMNNVA